MGRKRRVVLVLAWLVLLIFTGFTLAAMGNARTLGEAAFMAKNDALAILWLGAVAFVVLVVMLIAILTTPKATSA